MHDVNTLTFLSYNTSYLQRAHSTALLRSELRPAPLSTSRSRLPRALSRIPIYSPHRSALRQGNTVWYSLYDNLMYPAVLKELYLWIDLT